MIRVVSLFLVILLGYGVGYFAKRGQCLRCGNILLFVSGIIFLFSSVALLFDAILMSLPLPLQRNITLIVWFSLGLFIGYLGSILISKRQKIAFFVVSTIFVWLFYDYNLPIYTQIAAKKANTVYTAQTHLYSCSCAALSTLSNICRHQLNEREACKMMGTTKFGSNPGQLRYALDRLGFHYHIISLSDTIETLKPPAILFVDRRGGDENHAVVYLGKKEKYNLFDPMEGLQKMDRQQLQKIWHGHGVAVSCWE